MDLQPVRVAAATPDEDRTLARLAARGDATAFETLARRHQRRAYAVALGILRNPEDARDACQESLLRAFRAIHSFNGDALFSTWLHRIVVNLCLDQLRRRRGEQVEYDDAAESTDAEIVPSHPGFDPGRAYSDRETRERITAALAQLPALLRIALVLREIEGHSYAQIAKIVGCPVGTVMSRLFHARKRMQALLADGACVATGARAA